MIAIYISANQFKVSGNLTDSFKAGRRIKAACGIDGYKYSTVLSSSYAAPYTTVSISDSELTTNLTDILYGIVNIGESGSFPNHTHDSSEGQGGQLDFTDVLNNNISFLYLTDTPTTYSGFEDKYLKVTSSGISFVDIEESSGVTALINLTDTPDAYDAGKYLQATTSGLVWTTIEETDPIFLASPASEITSSGIENWNTAFSWGNHTDAGYLTEVPTQSGTGAATFLDLTDTPTTYSGSAGKYLITTTSGISYSNQLYKGKQSVKVEYKDDDELYINPGIVDVDGSVQEINARTTVSGSYLSSTWYFVYVNQSGSLTVSSGIPTLDYNKMGYYNDGDRCIGFFMTTAAGDIRRFSTFGQDYIFEEAAVTDYRDRPWGVYTTAETVTLTSVPLVDDMCIHFSGEANVSTSQSVFELSTTDSVNVKRLTKGADYIAGRCSMRCFNKQVVVTCTNASDFCLAVDGFILPSYIYTGA